MAMNGSSLVSLTPKRSLEFNLQQIIDGEKNCTAMLIIKNTSSHKIAFKVKTTHLGWYYVKPNQDVLQEGEVKEVQITLTETESKRILDSASKGMFESLDRHRFRVQTKIISAEDYDMISCVPIHQKGERSAHVWGSESIMSRSDKRLRVELIYPAFLQSSVFPPSPLPLPVDNALSSSLPTPPPKPPAMLGPSSSRPSPSQSAQNTSAGNGLNMTAASQVNTTCVQSPFGTKNTSSATVTIEPQASTNTTQRDRAVTANLSPESSMLQNSSSSIVQSRTYISTLHDSHPGSRSGLSTTTTSPTTSPASSQGVHTEGNGSPASQGHLSMLRSSPTMLSKYDNDATNVSGSGDNLAQWMLSPENNRRTPIPRSEASMSHSMDMQREGSPLGLDQTSLVYPVSYRRPHVLVACSGSVATLKIPELVAELSRFAAVRLVLSGPAAEHFLNRSRDYNDSAWKMFVSVGGLNLIVHESEEWKWNRMGDAVCHIALRKWAHCVLIAPASADILAKISTGQCDSLMLSVLRAWDFTRPILVAPAMNSLMWTHPATKVTLLQLRLWGYRVLEPVEKVLACNDVGKGALVGIPVLVQAVHEALMARDWTADDVSSTLPCLQDDYLEAIDHKKELGQEQNGIVARRATTTALIAVSVAACLAVLNRSNHTLPDISKVSSLLRDAMMGTFGGLAIQVTRLPTVASNLLATSGLFNQLRR